MNFGEGAEEGDRPGGCRTGGGRVPYKAIERDGSGRRPQGTGRATLAREEGEREEGFESERKFILGGTAGRSRLLTAALGARF